MTLNKSPLRRVEGDYALTALPLHTTIETQRRVDHDERNDYTYVWDTTPGQCRSVSGGGGRFGSITVDDCCLATCNHPTSGDHIDNNTSTTNQRPFANQLTPMSICQHPQNDITGKPMAVDFSEKCGTLSRVPVHVPAYVGCTFCGDQQQCLGDCTTDMLQRT